MRQDIKTLILYDSKNTKLCNRKTNTYNQPPACACACACAVLSELSIVFFFVTLFDFLYFLCFVCLGFLDFFIFFPPSSELLLLLSLLLLLLSLLLLLFSSITGVGVIVVVVVFLSRRGNVAGGVAGNGVPDPGKECAFPGAALPQPHPHFSGGTVRRHGRRQGRGYDH